MKLAVVQHGTGDHAEALLLTRARHRQWAESHGCAYLDNYTERSTPPQTKHWNKLICVREALNTHDAVFWLDSDTVVQRLDTDPRTAIQGYDVAGTYYITTLKRSARYWPFMGLGVFAISRNALSLLDAVLAKGPIKTPLKRKGPLFDEVRFNLELGKRPDIVVNRLPYVWNYFRLGYPSFGPAEHAQAEQDCIIRAWHGTPPETTVRRIKEYLCQL